MMWCRFKGLVVTKLNMYNKLIKHCIYANKYAKSLEHTIISFLPKLIVQGKSIQYMFWFGRSINNVFVPLLSDLFSSWKNIEKSVTVFTVKMCGFSGTSFFSSVISLGSKKLDWFVEDISLVHILSVIATLFCFSVILCNKQKRSG